ncbi:MAG: dihydrolipoyl dehydrogenase [Patescibacteria group bacterium]
MRKKAKKQNVRAKQYDLIIIGAGSAGFAAAEVASSEGAKVCLVEKGKLGGECPNWACVPTKALLQSAKMYHLAKNNLDDFGVYASSVRFSFARIMARKDAVVKAITGDGQKMQKLADKFGIDVVHGTASFVDSHTIQAAGKKFKAKKIIIATGSNTYVPPIDGIESIDYLDYRAAVSLKRLPESIAIVGGGPVACEFATFFNLLGSKVTILEISANILTREDEDISKLAREEMEKQGINIKTKTKTLSAKKEGRKLRIGYQTGSQPRQSILAEKILFAAGKRANIADLQLKKAGIKIDAKDRLVLKDNLQTSVAHIFAAGDVSGGLQFTHTAHNEGYIAAVNALAKTKRSFLKREGRVVPRVTFIDPEIASVGMTTKEATLKKKNFKVSIFPVGALGRSVTEGDRRGLIKIIVEKRTNLILGAFMIGPHAGEVIHELALAMYANLKVKDLSDMMHAFPTFSEAVAAVASQI